MGVDCRRQNATTAILGVCWFTLWTGFSFGAHFFTRLTIGLSTGHLDSWLTITALTICQLLIGYTVLGALLLVLKRKNRSSPPAAQLEIFNDLRPKPSMTSLYLAHAMATFATNASMVYANAGSVFTIKAFEPISTATLTSMLIGEKLRTHVIISLPLVVSGALGFVSTPSNAETATYGLALAFISNILFGVRNINLKLTHNIYSSAINKLEFLQTMSWNSAMFLYPVLFILFGAQGSLAIHISLVDSLISGVFHITYTVISTCVILKYTSTIGHATCNLLKRILVAIFFFLLGKTAISSSNWVMGMIMLIGLVIYILPDALIPIKGW